jgi:tRNA-uridine 2-sulfurtransferase
MSVKKKRVLVAMSGGVDSSVAAALLQEQGYDVVGVTMQVWDYSKDECRIDEGQGTCCSSLDVDDARAVADALDFPFYVANCETEFRHKVIDDFVANYLKGSTPIPCVNCNTFLKFDHLIRKMKELDCDYLATGHYAKVVVSDTGEHQIHTSADTWKDQTYFLFTLNPDLLSRLIFPVGDWQKSDLRSYAERKGLPVFNKKDSTGICFIGPKGYAHFIESQVPAEQLVKGQIRSTVTGEVLAQHDGIHRFTVGQRRGVGVATGEPMYVVRLEVSTGTVWMGPEKELYSSVVTVRDINELAPIREGDRFRVKIRYAHGGSMATVKRRLSSADAPAFELEFDEPQRAVTRGQAAVFYRDRHLVGGGWIRD